MTIPDELMKSLEKIKEKLDEHEMEAAFHMVEGCLLLCRLNEDQTITLLGNMIYYLIKKESEHPRKNLLEISKWFLERSKEFKDE